MRVNAHQGTVTLLRRADESLAEAPGLTVTPMTDLPASRVPATARPADEMPPPAPPVRAVPTELTAISLDFDPV